MADAAQPLPRRQGSNNGGDSAATHGTSGGNDQGGPAMMAMLAHEIPGSSLWAPADRGPHDLPAEPQLPQLQVP